MAWMIETFDKPGSVDLRLKLRSQHLAYLDAHQHLLMACGAKLDDTGQVASGGLYILDVDTREEAQKFIEDDPFYKGDLFADVTVTLWRKAYFNGRNTLDEG
ncbi:YciI family protein [Paracoccus albus]|uniref:YciI family protein n=1 Tax=Paracoccus albus TaxID=3017784 RepID=UPI0022F0FB7A|nr:YciI family protein [Paracoccus albus]WBU61673.1 YciI family protein [Paracoccus albus]